MDSWIQICCQLTDLLYPKFGGTRYLHGKKDSLVRRNPRLNAMAATFVELMREVVPIPNYEVLSMLETVFNLVPPVHDVLLSWY